MSSPSLTLHAALLDAERTHDFALTKLLVGEHLLDITPVELEVIVRQIKLTPEFAAREREFLGSLLHWVKVEIGFALSPEGEHRLALLDALLYPQL
jgi:hypothetical protein